MPFAIASGVITASGTDDLANCTVGVVDVGSNASRKVIAASRLVIASGAVITIDPETAIIYLSGGASSSGTLQVTGTLNVGKDTDNFDASFARQSDGNAIICSGSSGNGYSTFSVDVHGVLNWRGATITAKGTLNIDASGSLVTKNAIFRGSKTRQIRIRTANATIDGLTSIDSPVLIYSQPNGGIKGLAVLNADEAQAGRNSYAVLPYGSLDGRTTYSGVITFEDFAANGARNEIGLLDGVRVDLLNAVEGSGINVVSWLVTPEGSQVRRSGYARFVKRIIAKAADSSGVEIDGVRIYSRDYNNGSRAAALVLGALTIDDSADKIAQGLTAANGERSLDIITAIVACRGNEAGGAPAIDRRSKFNDSRDIFEIKAWKYDLLPASLSIECKGAGDGSADFVMFEDTTIAESDESIVDAYAEIDTAKKFYDAVKKHISDNYNGETAMPVSRAGELVTVDRNVTIDATAASVINITADRITIKADSFSGDITIVGGGAVTLSNGAEIDGVIIDANGDSAIEFSDNVNRWSLFETESDMLSNQNSIASSGDGDDVSRVWRFVFAAARSYFARVRAGNTFVGIEIEIDTAGIHAADISTAGLLTAQGNSLSELLERDEPPTASEIADEIPAAPAAAVTAAAAAALINPHTTAVASAIPEPPTTAAIAAATAAAIPNAPTPAENAAAIAATTPAAAFFANMPAPPAIADIATAVWQKRVTGDITAERAIEIMSSVIFGRSEITNNGEQVVFRDAAGNVIVRATVTAAGDRTSIELPNA